MKTTAEIIAYLETEQENACVMHDQAQGSQDRLLHLVRAHTIARLLEEIKKG